MKKTGDIEFAKRLKQAREKAGLTQDGLAAKAKISAVLLQKIEQGVLFGTKTTHEKLAAALGVSRVSLIFGDVEPKDIKEKILFWVDSDIVLPPESKRAIKAIINVEYEEHSRNAKPSEHKPNSF